MSKRRRGLFLIFPAVLSLLLLLSACLDAGRKINRGVNTSYHSSPNADRPVPAPESDNVMQVMAPAVGASADPVASPTNTPATHASDELALAAAMAPTEESEPSGFHGPERGDGWLTIRIRSLLLVRSDVSGAKTHVSVRDGIVTLTGLADSVAQKDLTETYARSVEGVRGVKNEMTVATTDALHADGATPVGNALEAKLDRVREIP